MNRVLIALVAIGFSHFYIIKNADSRVSAFYYKSLEKIDKALFMHTELHLDHLFYTTLALCISYFTIRIHVRRKNCRDKIIQLGLSRIGMTVKKERTKWKKRKGKIIIQNKNCFNEKELQKMVSIVAEIFKMELTTVKTKGIKAVFFQEKLPQSVDIVKKGTKNQIYIGEGFDGEVFTTDFSIFVTGQTGSGKTIALRSLIQSHIKNNEFSRVKIFDFKDEDFDDYKKKENVTFFKMTNKEELRKAIHDLRLEVENKDSPSTLFVFDEIGQYLSLKNSHFAKEETKELISLIGTILRTFRSTGKKVICATQRPQANEVNIPLSNFQAILAGRIDKSMLNRIRPELAHEEFGGGVWSFEDSTHPPIKVKTAYLKGKLK